ncbi:MAG: hypothetical protein K9G46_12680 [Flavobacteriales bacterium]|nr:hypothetical protein [Flavobacteriales bacterium]
MSANLTKHSEITQNAVDKPSLFSKLFKIDRWIVIVICLYRMKFAPWVFGADNWKKKLHIPWLFYLIPSTKLGRIFTCDFGGSK